MSTIGGASLAAYQLGSSIVGSVRSDSAADRSKAASAEQKSAVDRGEAAQKTFDVADAEFSAERDADGRQLYHHDEPADEVEIAAPEIGFTPAAPRVHAPDALGELGRLLDVDA